MTEANTTEQFESQLKSAEAAFDQGCHSAAVEICDELLSQQPNHRNALDLRGRACRSQGNHKEALQSWVALKDDESPQEWRRIRMFYTLLALKRYEEAEEIMTAARQQWPGEPRLLCHETAVQQALGRRQDIINTWSTINALETKRLDVLVQDPVYLGVCGRVAWAYIHQQQLNDALSVSSQMLALDAGNQTALNIRLTIHRQRKEWGKALGVLQTLVDNNPGQYQFLRQQILLLCSMGKLEKAEALFNQAISVNATNPTACAHLALVAESRMWSDSAQSLLRTVLELAPKNVELLVLLLEGYWDLGRVDMLVYLMNSLKTLNPEIWSANDIVKNVLTLLRVAGEEHLLLTPGRTNRKINTTGLVTRAIIDRIGSVEPLKAKAKYKVAMICSSMRRGGAERQLATCLNSISTDTNHRFDISLYCLSHDLRDPEQTYYEDIRDLPITLKEFHTHAQWDIMDHDDSPILEPWSEILRLLPRAGMQRVARLVYLLNEQKPDIVHAWQDGINIPAGLAALIVGVPRILLSAHTLAPDMGRDKLKLMPYNLHADTWHAAYGHLLHCSQISLCHNSHAGEKSYREWLGEPRLDMPVLYNGVDFDGIAKASEDGMKGESLDAVEALRQASVVGTATRLEPVKQPFLWIDVAQIVHAADPCCRFLIVGGGSMLQDCKQRVDELGLSDAFVFTGQTPTVKAWLELMDVFMMTSDTEGLPNALIEAQGFGVPAVSTDVGGTGEVIIDGVTGRIVPGDAAAIAATIISCLEDRAWLQSASIAAKQHARKTFSVSNMHHRLKALYKL